MQLHAIPAADAQPGDFGVTHGYGLFGSLVRFGDRISRPKPHGQWGHAFIVDSPEAMIAIEAKPSRVGPVSYAKYLDEGALIFTARELTGPQRMALVSLAQSMIGTRYQYLDILDAGVRDLVDWAHGEDARPPAARFGLPNPFDYDDDISANHHPRALICSVLVAYCWLAGAGVDLRAGQPLHRVTPGDLYRTVLANAAPPISPDLRG